MHKNLREMIFDAETVAHLKGFELQILPITEFVKFLTYTARDPEINTVDELTEKLNEYLDKQK